MKIHNSGEILAQHLYPYFEHKKYHQADNELHFYRNTSFGRSQIIVNALPYDDEIFVELHLGLRHHIVEKMLSDILGRSDYYSETSLTFITNALNLSNSELHQKRISCKSKDELLKAGDFFIDFMDRRGFDFLDHYKTLKNIDSLMNDKPVYSAKLVNHSYHRCFRAMVTAKVLNRNDYTKLYLMHQQYLAQRGFNGEILHKFNATFARLKEMYLN